MEKYGSKGYLELIIGPMFSGKTSKLIDYYNYFIGENKKVLAINYDGDNRYSNTNIVSHDNKSIESEFTNNLYKINNILEEKNKLDIDKYDVILVNEGQFFEEIVSWTKFRVESMNQIVIICGLDCDFKRELFGNLYKLIPICNSIIKLNAICKICNSEDGLFSYRTCNSNNIIVIGNDYIPLCRRCYLNNKN